MIPTLGECTWENKDWKHVHVLGREDKRKVVIIISSSTTWMLLPL
jgi:hypothetical protein